MRPRTPRELRIEVLEMRIALGGRSSVAAKRELEGLLKTTSLSKAQEEEQAQWLSEHTGESESDRSN